MLPFGSMVVASMRGCSESPEGVDDDRLGVLLNYVCSCTLLVAAAALARKTGLRRGGRGVVTELGMSLGYLLGGLVHDRFPNRAVRDVCAHYWFYPTFAASYAAMIASAYAWSGADGPSGGAKPRTAAQRLALRATRASLVASLLLIVGGATTCQFGGATLVRAKLDDCAEGHPTCDSLMLLGEGVFYVAWIAAWAVAAARVAPGLDAAARRHNVLSVAWLFVGPGQIALVCAVPLAFYPPDRAGEVSMRVYCLLRTGSTYILAVLGSHLSTSVVSGRLFGPADGGATGAVAYAELAPLPPDPRAVVGEAETDDSAAFLPPPEVGPSS